MVPEDIEAYNKAECWNQVRKVIDLDPRNVIVADDDILQVFLPWLKKEVLRLKESRCAAK